MEKFKIQTLNRTAHFILISEFKHAAIPFEEKNMANPPEKGEFAFGELTIKLEFQNEVQSILTQLNNPNGYLIFGLEKGKRQSSNLINYALIGYAVIITILLINNWDTSYNQQNHRNFEIIWNHNNSIVEYIQKNNQKIYLRYYDENQDRNFEKVEEYKGGINPSSISKDKDENGYFEDISFYNLNGDFVGKSIDKDNDQIFEFYEILLENGKVLKLYDKNNNGQFDFVEIR
ncbi:hypothetical protein [Flexithrix dorotheae]|uniref:hypothetical protein n=1 Tax=Flexithrix dorotheae TaxID=70993 RepID=UPI0003750981|nr:hypothetical protein [Flexithrix dorotheae]